MLAAAQPLSATRQNLWRLTVIRVLVLAAQAGSVGVAYWTELLPLPWLPASCRNTFFTSRGSTLQHRLKIVTSVLRNLPS